MGGYTLAMRGGFAFVILFVLSGCADPVGESTQTTSTTTSQPDTGETRTLPPGFMDPAPPPPTSDTVIWSGGTLLTDPPVEDAVVVVRNGDLLAWGRRGEVDVPNDSVGEDMSGKFLKPRGPLQAGIPVDIEILDEDPR